MVLKSLALSSLLCVCVTTADIYAQEESVGDSISGSLGFDLTSQYFFRGILQEDQGVIVQPWLELGINLCKSEGAVSSLDLTLGIWESLHSGPTGTGSKTSGRGMWYESDSYVGLSADLFDNFKLSGVYTTYHSPNGVFTTVQDLTFGVGYDDSSLWGEFGGFQPSVSLAFETSNQADGRRGLGTFLGLGLSPEYTFQSDDTAPVTLAVPVEVGLSLDDYYQDATGDDEFFGYFDLGVTLGMPLSWVTPRFGDWSMTTGVHLLWLGNTNEEINSGDGFEIIGSLGFSVDF